MFSGRHAVVRGADGAVFIDRCGKQLHTTHCCAGGLKQGSDARSHILNDMTSSWFGACCVRPTVTGVLAVLSAAAVPAAPPCAPPPTAARDGRHFADILNYLRTQQLAYPHDGSDFK
jgi:hypothetical protein